MQKGTNLSPLEFSPHLHGHQQNIISTQKLSPHHEQNDFMVTDLCLELQSSACMIGKFYVLTRHPWDLPASTVFSGFILGVSGCVAPFSLEVISSMVRLVYSLIPDTLRVYNCWQGEKLQTNFVCAYLCLRACVCASVFACMCVCVHVCVHDPCICEYKHFILLWSMWR